jgi:hypothetical protein
MSNEELRARYLRNARFHFAAAKAAMRRCKWTAGQYLRMALADLRWSSAAHPERRLYPE